MTPGLLTTPKIDCHGHLFDPERFPYQDGVAYRPAGGEIATADYFSAVMQANGVAHALLVGPNSGYGTDNRCMLDAIRHGGGRFKGIAVLDAKTSRAELQDLQAQGVVGAAFNVALLGADAYADADALFDRLAELELFVQVQVKDDEMVTLAPRLHGCGAKLLVDHHGRPAVSAGLGAPGFQALLGLADTGRCHVKLSGYDKFSRQAFPFADTAPFTQALLAAFGPSHCLWASDWPHVRAVRRLDHGPLLDLFARSVPDAATQRAILWDTPRRLFGFGAG